MKLSESIAARGDIEILGLEETGRTVRALRPAYGGKISQSVRILRLKPFDFIVAKVVDYYWYGQPDAASVGLGIVSSMGIPFSKIWNKRGELSGFRFVIDGRLFLSSFSTSDDPEVWKKKQQKEEERRKIIKVEEKLDKVG
jgi:hypothetical protein